MVLKRARRLCEIFDKKDLQFMREVHTYNGWFIHAKVFGKNVEIPYDDARVMLLRRGGNLKDEVRNLPVKRYYGANEGDVHFPVMRLGELIAIVGGREKFPLPSTGKPSEEAMQVTEVVPLLPPMEVNERPDREEYYRLMEEKYFTGDEGEEAIPMPPKKLSTSKRQSPTKKENYHGRKSSGKKGGTSPDKKARSENNHRKQKRERAYIKEMKAQYEEMC